MGYGYILLVALVAGSDQWIKKRIEESNVEQRERTDRKSVV